MRIGLFCTFFLSISMLAAQIQQQTNHLEVNGQIIPYVIDGPYAVTQGDVIVGGASEIENWRIAKEHGRETVMPQSLHQIFGTTGPQLWPNGIIYYTIDPSVTDTTALLAGISQWNTLTSLQVLPRTDQVNYVRFTAVSIDAACESYIGMIGGEQDIGVTNGCTAGSYAHEIGHAFGLLHEQQRSDRGGNLTILWEHIDKRFYGNFTQSPPNFASAGYYDFGSIMHYPYYGFSNDLQDNLETVPVGIPIGQRDQLSAGDIDGVSRLYGVVPTQTTVTTVPAGLPLVVDGATVITPQSFAWAPGTQHTVAASPAQGTDPRYVFASWSDGGQVSHTITASPDQTVFAANFAIEHPVQTGVFGGSGGSASMFPSPADGYLAERYPIQLKASPTAGSSFLGWNGLGVLSLDQYGIGFSVPSPLTEVVAIPRQSFSAVFTNLNVTTIDSLPHGLVVTVDGLSYLTPSSFTWSAGSVHTITPVSLQYRGNNTARYQFLNWDDGSTGTRTITAGNTATYTATFNPQYLLTTSVAGSGSITASPASPDGFYDAGTSVQLTAAPIGGVLRYWVGDVSSGDNPTTVVMDQQRSVLANMGPAFPFRVLSAASLTGNPNIGNTGTILAPGELIAIFGNNIGPASGTFATLDGNGNFPFSIAGYQVFCDSFPAAMVYAGPNQINAIVPYGISGQTVTTVKVQSGTGAVSLGMSAADAVPGLFTANGYGTGQVSAINQDYTINSAANPAPRGSVIVLYGTGGGNMDQTFGDGVVTGTTLGHISDPVWVRFGKLPGTVYYAGSAPSLVNGVFQINVGIPADLALTGDVPVQVIIGTYSSPPGTTISVR